MALNADKKPEKKSNLVRIHRGVVVRRQAEPDRSLVDTGQPQQEPLPGIEAAPAEVPKPGQLGSKRTPESIAKQKATLAAKKRKKTSKRTTPEQKEIALARVKALLKSGNGKTQAVVSVAKEMKLGKTIVFRWLAEDGSVPAPKGRDRSLAPRATAKPPASSALTVGGLLTVIKEATAEIERRLSQLSL